MARGKWKDLRSATMPGVPRRPHSPIRAFVGSDDGHENAFFDASAFFGRASDRELRALAEAGWSDSLAADAMALYMERFDDGVQRVLAHCEAAHTGYECAVMDVNEVGLWLANYRPDLLREFLGMEWLTLTE